MMVVPVAERRAKRDAPMPRYSGINHLTMVTGGMDGTIHFWRRLDDERNGTDSLP
jgi:hypothetical protein